MSESFNPAWRTPEPPVVIGIEKIIMACTLLGMITYGAHIAVYLTTLHAVLTSATKRHRWLQTAFISTLFAFATVFTVWDYTALVYAFVEYRNFPGGPAAFYPTLASLQESRYDFGNFSAVIITWLSDIMLIWRCYTVWSKKWVVIILPSFMWVASVVLGSITCVEAAKPQATLEALGPFNFNLSFWAVSLSLNMLLTALILTRLLRARASAGATLGKEHGQVYMGIAAIIIESALLYAVVGFVFIVTYGVAPLDGLTIQQVLVHIEAIAPELMVLRIARGRAWTSNTSAQLSTSGSKPAPLRFASTTIGSRTDGSRTIQDSHANISMVHLEQKHSTGDLKSDV